MNEFSHLKEQQVHCAMVATGGFLRCVSHSGQSTTVEGFMVQLFPFFMYLPLLMHSYVLDVLNAIAVYQLI